MLPLTIELELGDTDDAFTGSTNDWTITRPRLVADVCELDQNLQNSYSSHILAGKSLPFYLNGIYSVTASVPSGSSLYFILCLSREDSRAFLRSMLRFPTWLAIRNWSIIFTIP